MISQETLWLQYLQALSEKITLSAGEALQAIYPFRTWDWGGRDPVAGSFSYNEWLTLNVVPSNPYQNANADAAASQTGFDVAYRNWFSMLAIGDLEKDQHYRQLQDQLNGASSKLTTDYGNVKNVWRNQTNGQGDSLQTWLAEAPQMGYKVQLDEDAANLKSAQDELDDYRSRIATPVKAIEDAYANTNYQGNVTDPNSGKMVPLRLWATVPSDPYGYVREITDDQFGGDATKGHADSVDVNSNTTTYSYEKYYAEGGAGAWDDFIGFEAGGSYEQIDWSDFNESYQMQISWQDLTTVDIAPEPWYAGANITTYGRGPYANGFSAFAGSGQPNFFFGPGGALSRVYTGLVVAYRPTIRINASSSFATYLQQKWEAETGIEIGPFLFESEKSGERTQATSHVENGELVLESHADWPMIVAMKSSWTLNPEEGSR